MSEIITVGRDLAKNVFQVQGADGAGRTGRWYDLNKYSDPTLLM